MFLGNSYRDMQGLLETVNRTTAAVNMCISASKTEVISTLISDELHLATLFYGEPLEDVDMFRFIGSMFIANGQRTEYIRRRTNLPYSAFSCLKSCL